MFEDQTAIPVWLNLGVIPYSQVELSSQRTLSLDAYIGLSSAVISVPAPMTLTTINSVAYTNDAQVIAKMVTGGDALTTIESLRLFGPAQMLNSDMTFDKSTKGQPASPAGLYLRPDMTDMMFIGNEPKKYAYDITLLCISTEDAYIATDICTVLSTACWPTVRDGQRPNGSALMSPPHVFINWLSYEPRSIEKAITWIDGKGPSLSVLLTSTISKGFGQSGRILSFIDRDGDKTAKPLSYNISLQFSDMEPTFQIAGSEFTGTQNRTTALKISGAGNIGGSGPG